MSDPTLMKIEPDACPRCGIKGIHACLGKPMPEWTEKEKTELSDVLNQIFDENKAQ